jgi:antitoxin component YwqK of YwqJK toxin-antitoxin module
MFASRLPVLLLVLPLCAQAHRCVINGEEVNPDNGSTTAGKTGILTCWHDDGKKMYEQELRNGEHLGLDRRYGFDGSISERQVNANGNSEGPAKEFYPDGKLKSEGSYSNGSAVGLHKSYDKKGQLAGLHFYPKAGARAAVGIEYDEGGHVHTLSCAKQSLIPEDRALCGFEGRSMEVSLYQHGRVVEKQTLRDGSVLRVEGYDDKGRIEESAEVTPKGRIARRYYDSGKPSEESIVEGDYEIQKSAWYMNGALRSKLVTEPKERDARSVEERYADSGMLSRREERRGERLVHTEQFDEKGTRTEEFLYDDGRARLHRKFGPDGSVLLEEELYPDGSRKITHQIAG